MTTGDEQQPPFDPMAAAESFLQDPDIEDFAALAEDLATDQAEVERQQPLLQAFADRDTPLDVAEGETLLDKSIDLTALIDQLRNQWDSLSARIMTGDIRPGDNAKFDELGDQLTDSVKKGELVAMAQYIDGLVLDPDETTLVARIESTITEVASSAYLAPAEKQACLDVLEGAVGQEKFSQAMESIRIGTGLEEVLGRVAAQGERNVALAQEYQNLQEVLIQELGMDNIDHKDWLPFTQHLHQAVQLQRTATPEAKIMLELQRLRLQKVATRLGISSERLSTIFTHFGIEDTRE
jgi:AraC-like DNA-binding protein